MSETQLSFWKDVIARVVKTDEWRTEEQTNFFETNVAGPEETVQFLKAEVEDSKNVLAALGLIKK
jgi:tripartite-type tricarboxylate transporter receptor subunit TctC